MNSAKDVFVGRTTDGTRIYVDMTVRELDRLDSQTVNHEEITNYVEFTMSGLGVAKHCRNASSAGQMLEDLMSIKSPVKGLTRAEIREMHALWSRWHLNGMKAGCVHMEADAEIGTVCPETGYRYGYAWLIEPIPADTLARMNELIDKLNSLPERYNGE